MEFGHHVALSSEKFIVSLQVFPSSIFGHLGIVQDGSSGFYPRSFRDVEDVSASGFGSQGLSIGPLRGLALLSSCFGFLLTRDGINSGTKQPRRARITVEVIEVAEEVRVIVLHEIAVFGNNVISVAIRAIDGCWFESGLVIGSDKRCRRDRDGSGR